MHKRKIQFTNILLLLTLNRINVFGMNKEITDIKEETINKTQISINNFLNKIYEDLSEMQKAFQTLHSICYLLEKRNNATNNNDILEILANIKKQIENKEQFADKNPTEILMTNITLIKNYQEKKYNLFLDQDFFINTMINLNYMFCIIKNSSVVERLEKLTNSSLLDYAVKVFENISQYLTTMESFINDSFKENNELKVTLLTMVEDLKETNQNGRTKIEDFIINISKNFSTLAIQTGLIDVHYYVLKNIKIKNDIEKNTEYVTTKTTKFIDNFLNKIYEDVYEIYSAFRILNLSFYISLEKKNKDILRILEIIKATINNKKQFETKNCTEILMTNITLIINYQEKELNLFLDQDFFIHIIENTIFIFDSIINNNLFPQLKFFKEIINDKFNLFLLIKNDTIKVFESILKYLTTMKNFIIDALEEDNQLKSILLRNIEYLKETNQNGRTKIEDLQNIKLKKEILQERKKIQKDSQNLKEIERQKKMSKKNILNKEYEDFSEIKRTFQRLDDSFYIQLEKDNQYILEIFEIEWEYSEINWAKILEYSFKHK